MASGLTRFLEIERDPQSIVTRATDTNMQCSGNFSHKVIKCGTVDTGWRTGWYRVKTFSKGIGKMQVSSHNFARISCARRFMHTSLVNKETDDLCYQSFWHVLFSGWMNNRSYQFVEFLPATTLEFPRNMCCTSMHLFVRLVAELKSRWVFQQLFTKITITTNSKIRIPGFRKLFFPGQYWHSEANCWKFTDKTYQ